MASPSQSRRKMVQRQRILDVLFSFGWLNLKELAFYTDLDADTLIEHLDEGPDALVPSGRVARRRRQKDVGRGSAAFEYTVDPY